MLATVTVEVPDAIKALSNDQLLALYNRWGTKPCKKFEKRSCGERRVARLLNDLEMSVEDAVAPPLGYAGEGWDATFPTKVEDDGPTDPDHEDPAYWAHCAEMEKLADNTPNEATSPAGWRVPDEIIEQPVEAPTKVLKPGLYWVGIFDGPGQAGSSSEPFSAWEGAANWLRAILETVSPEHSLGSLRDMLSNATPSYPFAMSDEKRKFSLCAVDETGTPVEVKSPEPVVQEVRIAPPANEKKAKVRSEAKAGNGKLELTGKKAELFALLQRETGATIEEGCAALGWKKCGATLGRLMTAAVEAGFQTRKEKDAGSGKMRYYIA